MYGFHGGDLGGSGPWRRLHRVGLPSGIRQPAVASGILGILRWIGAVGARNGGFSDGRAFVGSAGERESAILLPDPMQQVVNGIASKPLDDGSDNDGREGANDKGKGGNVEGA